MGLTALSQVLLKATPKMLAHGGQKPVKDEMREIIEGITSGTLKRDRSRLLELITCL